MERQASGAAAGPSAGTPGAASTGAASSGLLLPGSARLRPVTLSPGGFLTSDLIARATGTAEGQVPNEGYQPISRVAYQVRAVAIPTSSTCCRLCMEASRHAIS